MRAAGEAAYQVNLVYVGVRDVRHSIGRVRERVSRGGHDVPIADLWRRFDRSLANLAVAMQLANHRVLLIDNSGKRRRLLLSSKAGREIGRAQVRTPVTNAPLVCRLLLETKNKH